MSICKINRQNKNNKGNRINILGLDPGTIKMGFGVIQVEKDNNITYVHSGTLFLSKKEKLEHRLFQLGQKLDALFTEFQLNHVAIEKVFFGKNPDSAFKLGLAYSVGLYKSSQFGCQLFQYSTTKVKKTVAGSGGADKESVRNFIYHILKVEQLDSYDASDALAVALCHAYHFQNQQALEGQVMVSF